MSIPISVMTIIHNGEPFVERCYQNLLAERFTEWEWVVVNDGSDDRTEAILLCPPLHRAVMSFRPRGELVEGHRLTAQQEQFLSQFRHQNGKT